MAVVIPTAAETASRTGRRIPNRCSRPSTGTRARTGVRPAAGIRPPTGAGRAARRAKVRGRVRSTRTNATRVTVSTSSWVSARSGAPCTRYSSATP